MSDDTTDNYSATAQEGDKPSTPSDKIERKRRLVEAAKEFRKKGDWDARWSKFIDVYANRYAYPELGDWDDTTAPNMVFSTVNVIVPSIAVNNPKIEVEAQQAEDEPIAPLVQAVVNDQWEKIDAQRQVRQAAKDAVICGHGWAKVTWDYAEEDVQYTQQEFMQLVQETLMNKQTAIQAAPDAEDSFPSDEELIKALPTEHDVVVRDDPKVTRISIFDLFVDPDATRIEDARWIAHRIFEPIEAAKRNENYNEKARKALTTVYKSKARDNEETDDAHKDDTAKEGFAEIWEFYDLVNGEVCTFAAGSDQYLVDPAKTRDLYRRGHPFHMLENYEVPERLFPAGDVEAIYPLQVELAMIRTAQLNDMKRGRRITLFRESALGKDGIQALRDGKDNVMIPVLKDVPFGDVFAQINSMGLQPEWYAADQKAMADINTVSGISDYVRGGQSDIRRTATEVGVMQDQSNARLSDKLAKIEGFMAEIAKDMVWLSQRFMDTEHVVKIVSDPLAPVWEAFTRQDLQGEFSFRVEAGSSQPINESFRMQQAARLMDTFGGLLGTGMLNDQAFLAEVLRLNGFKNGEKLLGPGVPPPMPEAGPGGPPDRGGANPPVPGNIPGTGF